MTIYFVDCRERGFHARGVYHTKYISRMGTAGLKQEEEADTGKKYGSKKLRHYERKSSTKQAKLALRT